MAQQRLSFWHPASLIATWFGSGLLPKFPGTWGSLAALPFAALIVWFGGPWLLAAAALAAFVVGLWASELYTRASGEKDPGAVVIDEVAGLWLALIPAALLPAAAVPAMLDWRLFAIGFAAFRFFDITKVWPANLADRKLKGCWGIMTDDIIAGCYAAAVTYGLSRVLV